MNCIAVSANGYYYNIGRLTQMRDWANRTRNENHGGSVEIYRLNRDGSMGEFYERLEL